MLSVCRAQKSYHFVQGVNFIFKKIPAKVSQAQKEKVFFLALLFFFPTSKLQVLAQINV